MDRLHEELKLPDISCDDEDSTDDSNNDEDDDYLINNGKGLLGGNASSDGSTIFCCIPFSSRNTSMNFFLLLDSPVDMESDCSSPQGPLSKRTKQTNLNKSYESNLKQNEKQNKKGRISD